LQEDLRSGGGHVDVDVIERRVIQHAVSAADYGLAFPVRKPPHCGEYAKPTLGPKAVLGRRERWEGASGKWNGLSDDGAARGGSY